MAGVGSYRGQRGRLIPGEELGRGTYGQVIRVRIEAGPGRTTDAAAKIQDHTMDSRRLSPEEPTSLMLRELAAMDALADVPGVPPVLGVTGGAAGIPPYSIVMPRYDGDLGRTWGRLAPAAVRRLLIRLLRILAEAHGRGIVHRDVSATNILVRGDDEAFLGDWGTARVGGVCAGGIPLSTCVTAMWHRAPEILCGDTRYSNRVDIWSAGVVALLALCDQAVWPVARSHVHSAANALRALARVYAFSEWDWAQSLPGYQNVRVSRYGRVLPLQARIAESMGPGRRDAATTGLISAILAALTLDPARRPSAVELLRWMGDTPPPARPLSPRLGPVLSVGANVWGPSAVAILQGSANLIAAPEIRTLCAIHALEFLEVSIGRYRKGSIMGRALPLSCVLLADRLASYEDGCTGRSPLPECVDRLIADLPRGTLAGVHSRYAILQRLGIVYTKGVVRRALSHLLRAMCWVPAVRLAPARLVAACLTLADGGRPAKNYLARRVFRVLEVALLAYSRGSSGMSPAADG